MPICPKMCQYMPPGRDQRASNSIFSEKRTLHSVSFCLGRWVQALGATSNVMALLLVNMIGYAAGIQKTGRVADGIFIDREGIIAAGYAFVFVFGGVQVRSVASCGCLMFHAMHLNQMLWQNRCRSLLCSSAIVDAAAAALIHRAHNMHAVSCETLRAQTPKSRFSTLLQYTCNINGGLHGQGFCCSVHIGSCCCGRSPPKYCARNSRILID